MANRLASEPSAYLRQHADNPVHWWPWGPEAFAEAARLGRPVFVSVGYAACHWCHVMAHESFEDGDTAALMNAHFVNVKVDREERPEVDAIYMNAIQVQGEGGGWPLSAFCMPDGRPFFLGTYFPPVPRFGRPSFRELLRMIAEAYQDKRDQLEENAAALLEGLSRTDSHYRQTAKHESRLEESYLVAAGRQVVERCDPKHGGLSGAPKFPSCSTLDVLARAARLGFGGPARQAFLRWCRGLCDGGIYDHLGGGWARYSVDDKWLVPHFEKMLYDQAQLLSACAVAHGLDDAEPRWRERMIETVGFLARELRDPCGGLWSSLDADSEGEEGKFYVWTPAQLEAALGKRAAIVFAAAYGVTPSGTFEHGQSVLARSGRGSVYEEAELAQLRQRLLAARAERVRPGTDDKVLASWNGLAISGLLAAWRATGHEPALALARQVAAHLRQALWNGETLSRIWGKGQARLAGTLEDYAFCALAMLDLAEAEVLADGAPGAAAAAWQLGVALVTVIRQRFVEEVDGVLVFYLAPGGDALLVHRPESHHDGAIPAAAAVAVQALLRLGLLAEDAEALALAERTLRERLGDDAGAAAFTRGTLLSALDLYLHHQIVVISEGAGRAELLVATREARVPTVWLAGPFAAPSLLQGKLPAADGSALAYVCRGATCSAPLADPAALRAKLRG